MLEDLKAEVCRANLELVRLGLVTLTWGNVSGLSADRRHLVIKPSGVSYDRMTPESMAVVDMEGNPVEGDLHPSSDTSTHLRLYRAFEHIGGITHTHSPKATAFAQARREIPCLGTTHADHFFGPVPVTRPLSEKEVEEAYEANTGEVIVERFQGIEALEMPGVLVAGHGPFAWGNSAADSVKSAVALEAVAEMALDTLRLSPSAALLESHVLKKHYQRKHGPSAYYGQETH